MLRGRWAFLEYDHLFEYQSNFSLSRLFRFVRRSYTHTSAPSVNYPDFLRYLTSNAFNGRVVIWGWNPLALLSPGNVCCRSCHDSGRSGTEIVLDLIWLNLCSSFEIVKVGSFQRFLSARRSHQPLLHIFSIGQLFYHLLCLFDFGSLSCVPQYDCTSLFYTTPPTSGYRIALNKKKSGERPELRWCIAYKV